jgi:hypothetical protein
MLAKSEHQSVGLDKLGVTGSSPVPPTSGTRRKQAGSSVRGDIQDGDRGGGWLRDGCGRAYGRAPMMSRSSASRSSMNERSAS